LGEGGKVSERDGPLSLGGRWELLPEGHTVRKKEETREVRLEKSASPEWRKLKKGGKKKPNLSTNREEKEKKGVCNGGAERG